jgi:hypothetical protein
VLTRAGAHARVGQHQRQHVVGQRLLQVDVAARHALGDARRMKS